MRNLCAGETRNRSVRYDGNQPQVAFYSKLANSLEQSLGNHAAAGKYNLCPTRFRFMLSVITKLSSAGSSGLFNLLDAVPLSDSDFEWQIAPTMNVNKSLIAPVNTLDLPISTYYPRTLKAST